MSFDRDSVYAQYQQADAEIKAKASRIPNPFTAIGNYFFGKIAANLVLPAQSDASKAAFAAQERAFNLKALAREYNADKTNHPDTALFALTQKVGELDTTEIFCLDSNQAGEGIFSPPDTYIINFCANSQTYQDQYLARSLCDLAVASQASVIGFNYPGVGASGGSVRTRDDLINAGIAQVERLLKEGVEPAKITLTGTSLGGAVSTMVAKHFNDRGVQINLFNKQSFANLTDVVVGNVRTGSYFDVNTGSGRDAGFFQRILGAVLKPIVKLFLVATKFEMDVAEAYRSLPDERKSYSVARTPLSERWQRLHENEIVIRALEYVGLNVPRNDEFTKSQKRVFLRDAHKRMAVELKKHQAYLNSVMNEIEKNNDKVLDPSDRKANEPLLQQDTKLNMIRHRTEIKIENLQKAMALIMPKDDGTITSYGSLHRALKADRKSKKTEDSHHKVYHQDDAHKNVHMHSSESLTRADKTKLSDVFLRFHRRVTTTTPKPQDDGPAVSARDRQKPGK